MSDLPTIFDNDSLNNNDTPLPLIVAKRWNFILRNSEVDGSLYYAIQDWIRGLTTEEDTRKILNYLKRQPMWSQMSSSTRRLPYHAPNGKTYQRDFTTDKGLYLIAQYLRVTKDRPVLDEIRKFLAAAGAFVDEIRVDPDKVLDAAIEAYRAQGKSDAWIQMRMQGKISRHQFTTALTNAILDSLGPNHYAIATDDVYRSLWGRTASHLRRELDLTKKDSLRDHQPLMALYYQGLVEEGVAKILRERQEVTWHEAREIVKQIGEMLGRHAREYGEFLGIDMATGLPLLGRR